MATQHVRLSVEKMPEVIFALRKEMACILRAEADGEPEIVAAKLRALAAAFECGQCRDGGEAC